MANYNSKTPGADILANQVYDSSQLSITSKAGMSVNNIIFTETGLPNSFEMIERTEKAVADNKWDALTRSGKPINQEYQQPTVSSVPFTFFPKPSPQPANKEPEVKPEPTKPTTTRSQ